MELLKPKEIVFDRFKIEEATAGGGQSFGFRGQDLHAPPDRPWQRPVFIKQYHDLIPGSAEAKSLSAHFDALNDRLREDSGYLCLPVHVGEVNNSIVAVFPLVRGKSLKTWMDEGLTQDQCVRFAQAITNAIRILHKANIAHLDLKPENVMIEENWKSGKLFVRLIDTDAAQIDGVGLRAKIIGTKGYMSPEHFAPQQYGAVSRASDVFTLGVLLYGLLFKEHPYPHEDYNEFVESESFEVPPNSYHREIVEQIVGCLHAYPSMRPQAGWVHSTFHQHYSSDLEAIGQTDLWLPRYVQVAANGFQRTYFGGVHLGRNHFRGSALTNLPSKFLRLRISKSGPLLELTDRDIDVLVCNKFLRLGEPCFLRTSDTATICGVRFGFSFHL